MLMDLIGTSFTCSDHDAWNRAWAWWGGRFARDKSEHLEKQTEKTGDSIREVKRLLLEEVRRRSDELLRKYEKPPRENSDCVFALFCFTFRNFFSFF
jgi:hypothetical protein